MTTMIQTRNVPDEVHRTLKARAALAGMSLSEFILMELRKLAEIPTRQEVLARMARNEPVLAGPSSVELIRHERGAR